MVKRTSAIQSLLLSIGSACVLPAEERTKEKEAAPICIRLLDSGVISGTVLGKAEGVTGRILASAGVRVLWDDRHANQSAVQTIHVRFVHSTRDESSRFATSFPFAPDGVRIIVFANRVEAVGKQDPRFTSRLLGHVLAHEIGHVLMRTDQHTGEGLMKARWSEEDYAKIRVGYLKFARESVEAILIGLAQTDKQRVGKQ